MNKNSRLVYSTSSEKVTSKEFTEQKSTMADTDGIVRIHRQTKGRKGNGVSVIVGLITDEANVKTLAKQLKRKLGVGGSVKQGNIELQTSDREQIKEYLRSQGYKVKIAGG